MTQLNQSSRQRQAARRSQDFKPYLLLDAGGTVVFPNQEIIHDTAQEYGIRLNQQNIYRGYYQVIHQLDVKARELGRFPEPWPRGYARALFDVLGFHTPLSDQAAEVIHQKHLQHNLWTFTFPWVRDALDELKDHVSGISILSNSDGRTKQVFCELGLNDYFDEIFDSAEMRIEKPNPEIFRYATKTLGLNSWEVLHVGDIYALDVVGAGLAGIRSVHIDPFELYNQESWPGTHIRSIQYLPDWLIKHPEDPFRSGYACLEYTTQPVQLPNHAGV